MGEHPGREALRLMVEKATMSVPNFPLVTSEEVQQVSAYVAEMEAQVAEARVLIHKAATRCASVWNSTPGCFYCDCDAGEQHMDSCEANDWLARTAPKPKEQS